MNENKKKAYELLAKIDLEEDKIANLPIIAETRLIKQTQLQRISRELTFWRFRDIEQWAIDEAYKNTDKPSLKDWFIMGVIVEKQKLSRSFKSN